jgi:tetratricopeptide (TPR) repeat protein
MSEAVAAQAAAAFQSAITLHQQGRLEEARTVCGQVLQLQPEHVAGLRLLGAIALASNDPATALDSFAKAIRTGSEEADLYVSCGHAHSMLGEHEAAIAQYDRAITLDPESNATPYYCRGTALQQLKRHEAAVASYDQAIALESDLDGVAHYCRATALLELKQYAAAIASFEKAIAFGPPYAAGAHCGRGIALSELKRWEEALTSYERAIALAPNYAEAFYNRGVVLAERKQWEAALASYERAIALEPDHAEACANRGVALAELGRWEAALASLERAIALRPDYAEAYSSRGVVLAELKRWGVALASYERALALKADYVEALSNRGNALNELNQWEAALASYDRAIALRPGHVEALSNRGNVLCELKQWDAAAASYERACLLQPDFAEAHINRSMLWLLLGNYANGWREYEWRSKHGGRGNSADERRFSEPRWSGEGQLAGKTILLYGEQGLGDTLQFCRYASSVAERGARVVLEAHEPLLRVLSSLAGVSELLPRGSPLPPFDCHCPLMSLPLACSTDLHSIPRANRYLTAEASTIAHWQARLGPSKKPRVGLAWSGNADHRRDRLRSIALAELLDYLPEDIEYVSLQKDMRESDRRALQSSPHISSFVDEIADFADTAALCECLDLVVSVDTSVAHLSASLGRPTWILLPFVPDWRWLLDRSDSPWYPSVTLYRQTAATDWTGVLERLRRDLSAMV